MKRLESVKLKKDFMTYDGKTHRKGSELFFDMNQDKWVLGPAYDSWYFGEEFIIKMTDYFEFEKWSSEIIRQIDYLESMQKSIAEKIDSLKKLIEE